MTSLEEQAEKGDVKGIMVTALMTAFAFVVGLFWKDAITETINSILPGGEGLIYKYISAIIATVIITIMAFLLVKTNKKKEEKLAEE